ncbi:MAG: outer membrane beta-barrel protein [Bacteroidales bacterium]|nr:outer membrane beta-barrel protein [Bacteroidales bacterium]
MVHLPASAQFTHFGAKVGLGASYVTDDLLTTTPIMGANLGGYVNYMFTDMKNPWADNIYLEGGFYLTRRGTNLQQVFVEMQSIRDAYYHTYGIQIPVMVGFKYEIPQLPAENYAKLYFGPAFNLGVWGRIWDRQVTPGMPQSSLNYDTYITGTKDDRSAFKHLRRVDLSVILGVGYQWHNWTVDLVLDHGFVSLMKKDDVLINLQNQTNPNPNPNNNNNNNNNTEKNRNAYLGTNQTIMLSIGYQLPFAE